MPRSWPASDRGMPGCAAVPTRPSASSRAMSTPGETERRLRGRLRPVRLAPEAAAPSPFLCAQGAANASVFLIPFSLPSTLFRSNGVEIREHRLDGLALAVRTKRVRPPVLSDALPTLKDRSTFLASEFIGRHDEDLEAKKVACGPMDRHAPGRNSVYARPKTRAPWDPICSAHATGC